MNAPEWIEYDGSDKQIEEIKSAKSYLVICIDIGEECSKFISGPFVWVDTSDHIDPRIRAQSDLREQMEASDVTHYLICQPHPYADLIKKWADTGCPVWVRPTKPYEFKISDYLNHPTTKLMVDHRGVYLITTAPDWNIPAKFSAIPPNKKPAGAGFLSSINYSSGNPLQNFSFAISTSTGYVS